MLCCLRSKRAALLLLPMLLPLMLTTFPTLCSDSRGVVAVTWSSPASSSSSSSTLERKRVLFECVPSARRAVSAVHSSRLARTRCVALYKAYVIEKQEGMRREPQWATKIELENIKRDFDDE